MVADGWAVAHFEDDVAFVLVSVATAMAVLRSLAVAVTRRPALAGAAKQQPRSKHFRHCACTRTQTPENLLIDEPKGTISEATSAVSLQGSPPPQLPPNKVKFQKHLI